MSSSNSNASHRNIYVAGLPLSYNDTDLFDLIAQHCGDGRIVESIKCVIDPRTKKCRGYGFVLFHEPWQATNAVQSLDGLVITGLGESGVQQSFQLQVRPAHATAKPSDHDITSRSATHLASRSSPSLPPPPSYIQSVTPQGVAGPSPTMLQQTSQQLGPPIFIQLPMPQQRIPNITPSTGSPLRVNPPAVVYSSPLDGMRQSFYETAQPLASQGSDQGVQTQTQSSPKPFLVDSLFTSSLETPLFSGGTGCSTSLQQQPSQQHAAVQQSLQQSAMSFSQLPNPQQGYSSPSNSISNLFEQLGSCTGQPNPSASVPNDFAAGEHSGRGSPPSLHQSQQLLRAHVPPSTQQSIQLQQQQQHAPQFIQIGGASQRYPQPTQIFVPNMTAPFPQQSVVSFHPTTFSAAHQPQPQQMSPQYVYLTPSPTFPSQNQMQQITVIGQQQLGPTQMIPLPQGASLPSSNMSPHHQLVHNFSGGYQLVAPKQ